MNNPGKFLRDRLQNITDGFGKADDAYQGFMRDKVLQLPEQGMLGEKDNMNVARNFLGETFFAARPGAKDVNPNYQLEINNAGDRAAAVGMRAAHGGAITAAGAGLASLTQALTGGYGGEADVQPPQQISL